MTHRILPLLAVVGLLAACGGDDDTAPAAESTTTADDTAATAPGTPANDDTAGDETGGDETGGDDTTGDATGDDTTGDDTTGDASVDDTIVIDSLDDVPRECVDLMSSFLQEIEPFVEDIDWSNASLSDFEAISEQLGEQLDERGNQLDADLAASGCDRYDIGDDDELSLQLLTELAEREAPGTVGWLEFLHDLAEPAGSSEDGAPTADVPTDCDGAIGYLEEMVSEYDSFKDVPLSEAANVTVAIGSVQQNCTLERAQEFFSSPELAAFLEG